MDRLKKLFTLLLLGNCWFGMTQNDATGDNLTTNAETVYLHCNASTFITGETVYCKMYCLNPADNGSSTISSIAYLELIDSHRKSIHRQKIDLKNGTGQGEIFLSAALSTGNYKLIAYTRWMLNQPDAFFQTDLTIINPYQPLDQANINTMRTAVEESSKVAHSNPHFSITTDKRNYGLREKVLLEIKSDDIAGGNYSLSVRKTDALPEKKQIAAQDFSSVEKNTIATLPLLFLPELRGELVTGYITSKKGGDVSRKTVALSIPGAYYALKISETDRKGKFKFVLDKNPASGDMTLQVIEADRDDYSIHIDESKGPNLSALQFPPQFRLTPDLRTALEERAVANQVENAYYAQKKDSIFPDVASDPFFHTLEKEYVLDDYTRFPTMKETITEVITELYYRKEHNKYVINLRNNLTNTEAFGTPLLLVDGLLIQDANSLFDYNTENIHKISVINQPYIYGPKTYSGVISIHTKNQDYQSKLKGDFLKEIVLPRPLNRKQYHTPNYAKDHAQRIPDYRYQLLWQPEINLDQAINTISFYTSDVSGRFEIVFEGFTADGKPVSITDLIEVR